MRDWLETTVSYVKENMARWFKFQRIVDSYTGAEGLPFPLKGYLRKDNRWISGIIDDLAPLIQKRRDIDKLPRNIPKVLLHFALKGGLLPEWLLYQAVNRNRMEQNVTRSRVAIIKMVLLSRNNKNNEEGKMECLDLENRNPAYLCGRLLGVLEIVQVEAFKPSTINSTIVDRFYGTASSAPASVFGRLLRGVQPHLTKLRKEKHGTFEAMAKQLEEVQCGLTFYPKTLTLEEQGFFALGYYHQKAANRAGAIAYKQSQQDADKANQKKRRNNHDQEENHRHRDRVRPRRLRRLRLARRRQGRLRDVRRHARRQLRPRSQVPQGRGACRIAQGPQAHGGDRSPGRINAHEKRDALPRLCAREDPHL